jgi:L-ascorbate metabolism protein UlaG (beta-lactamase superfamily)
LKPWFVVAVVFGCLAPITGLAQDAPRFLDVQRQTNNEVQLKVVVPTGQVFRVEAASELSNWEPVVTVKSTSTNQIVDTAAPFLGRRFYRAISLDDTNALTGDHLVTLDGDVLIHPVNHASFVMKWKGLTIYNDPVGAASLYKGIPAADLVLISHAHSDHFDTGTLTAIKQAGTLMVAPAAVYTSLSTALKAITIPLAYGSSTNLLGLTIDTIPAYNSNHPKGTGNGYIVTIGGRRLYMSGDTGDIAEMKTITGIDVAFVCVNVPYTMTVNQAAAIVRIFQPKVVYPYHYKNADNSLANLTSLKQLIGSDLGIEVRQRKWY